LINIVCTLWSFLKSHCANVSIQHYYNGGFCKEKITPVGVFYNSYNLFRFSHTAEQRLVEVIGTREILRHTNGSSKPRESQCITFKMNVAIQRTKFVLWFSRQYNPLPQIKYGFVVFRRFIYISHKKTFEEYYFLLSMIVLRALTHTFTVLSSANI